MLPDGLPPAAHASSVFPGKSLVFWVGSLACGFVFTWFLFFVFCCVVLSFNNNAAVHEHCGVFWDFMLLSVLSPLVVPVAYFMLAAGRSFPSFYTFSMLLLSLGGFVLTLQCSARLECVDSLRHSTPPLPLLLYLGWFKAIAFGAGSYSILSAQQQH